MLQVLNAALSYEGMSESQVIVVLKSGKRLKIKGHSEESTAAAAQLLS